MPVYLYKNLTTGATFEVEQRIAEDTLTVDPTSGDPVKRLIQPVGIAFKGSGFYATDSRKTSRPAPKGDATTGDASKTDTPKSDAPKSVAPKSDATPATKPAAAKPASRSSGAAGD